eukprot:scaffold21044_cov124-Isochrysis_galbana.AAC.7
MIFLGRRGSACAVRMLSRTWRCCVMEMQWAHTIWTQRQWQWSDVCDCDAARTALPCGRLCARVRSTRALAALQARLI